MPMEDGDAYMTRMSVITAKVISKKQLVDNTNLGMSQKSE